jgi:hypothetical protein
MNVKKRKKEKTILGWREWISLPNLSKLPIKAKVDTGAKTSVLHAHNIEIVERHNKTWVTFEVVPSIKTRHPILAKALLIDYRTVKSSMGETTKRPVINTIIRVGPEEYSIELTLVDRSLMGYRMLIGRQALRRRFLINPSRSFLLDKKRRG